VSDIVEVTGLYFEDLRRGFEYGAPGLTLTTAHAAIYQSTFGDRLMLPLDHLASSVVTGCSQPLAHPLLAINIAIGQSTWVSQRVKANLFYRGLSLLQQVYVGDTLYTVTRVVGLRRNKQKAGRAATGMVGLEVTTRNQHNQTVLHFWRCPMLPCRNEATAADSDDDFDTLGSAASEASIPDWQFERVPGLPFDDGTSQQTETGTVFKVEARDTVTVAPEFVRLTLNMAMAHTDVSHSHLGARLVYGGHTISMCFAQLTRAFPRLATLVSWKRCDHIGPVVEGDRLHSEFTVLNVVRHPTSELLTIEARCFAARAALDDEVLVLVWVFTVLNATA
jgi:2-methylfumaryl-CoA hydratase